MRDRYVTARVPAAPAAGSCTVRVECSAPCDASVSVSEFAFSFFEVAADGALPALSAATRHFVRTPTPGVGRKRPRPPECDDTASAPTGAATARHDALGQTRAHHAAVAGDAKALRSAMADDPTCVHDRDRLGRSPLHLAAWHGHLELVRLLCEGGAEREARDCRGRTALYYAELHRRDDVCSELKRLAEDADAREAPDSDSCGFESDAELPEADSDSTDSEDADAA